jgi:predicted ATPase/two-component sensor histidine kinase/tRNA A-37 threonylcarbamoyl transferase component Bud32
MLSLPGYRITSGIYESVNSLVYRGVRELDLQPLVFKVLKPNYPTPDELTRYRQEYAITRSLNLEGVIKAYGMEAYQNTLVIILEDFGGESLRKHLTQRSFSLEEVLTLGIRLAEILGQVHQQQVIHKDINPANIVWNPATNQLKLIDFGIASRITRETPTLRNANVLEGTIAYMSPEQTGRMNRSLDYRTDFYSLGATLYELLTQQLPFTADNALGLVHCHLAKRPIPPCDRAPAIPQAVSDIVMKLLAKTAEDRYQSYRGIQVDLETCLTQLQATNHISVFPLAQQDSSDCFQIPQKLYGRDQEIKKLIATFEATVQPTVKTTGQPIFEETLESTDASIAKTTPELKTEKQSSPTSQSSKLMLISGYSGIGKTSLVQEIYKPITQQRGYFIAGKFDQYQRDIPYSAFVSAFTTWIEHVLTESEARLSQWRETLLAALAPNASVLIEVIPELELIVGQQPLAPELPAAEARNRLKYVLQQFIQVLAQPSHPLVIFLDDLQWVDRASLQVIQVLMTTDVPFLFLIGAYRDNEVNTTHPLMQSIEEMQKAGTPIDTIALSPLQKPDLQQLLADTLNCSVETVAPLADLVLAKTNGNPFFANEFLRALYVEHLLTFDYHHSRWEWSIAAIQQRNITDNVVELLVAKIQRLEQPTQDALRRAACIGNQFDLQTLTFVLHSAGVLNEPSPSATLVLLKEAINIGLILPLNDSYKRIELDISHPSDAARMEYKFAHDRIQQAAYSLNSEAERLSVHRQIGQQLLHNTPLDQQSQKLFDIVNHLNLSQTLIETRSERDELARFNLMAGEKAKASTAYDAAFQYFCAGLELLAADSWQSQYDMTLSLYQEATEAAYLCSNLLKMENLAAIALPQARTILDQLKFYEVKIQAHLAQGQQLEGLQMALQLLAALDVTFPEHPEQAEVEQMMVETRSLWEKQPIADLIDLPAMSDPNKLAAMRLLSSAVSPSHTAFPALFPLIVLKQVILSIQYGNTSISPFSYAVYGLILAGVALDIDAGYQFSQLAFHLLERLNFGQIRAKTLLPIHAGTQYWKEHLRDTLQPLQGCYQAGVDNGDLEFAGYTALHYCDQAFFVGMPLPDLTIKMLAYRQNLVSLSQIRNADAIAIFQQATLNLTSTTDNPGIFIGTAYDESHHLPLLQQVGDLQVLFLLYLSKLIVSYIFQDHESAIAYADAAALYIHGVAGQVSVAFFRFYDSLARLAIYTTASPSEQTELFKQVAANQELMHLWATHAPMNYLHKWHLVEAERHRVLGEQAEAIAHYDRAADLAKAHNYIHEKALTYERTALFYLEQGKEIIAKAYLQEARYCYLKWGATAKVQALEAQHFQLSQQAVVPKAMRSSSPVIAAHPNVSLTTTDSSDSEMLDLATVIKASQVLSGELNVDKLLTQLMTLVLQNAGAQTGTLLLEAHQTLSIEATGTVDPAVVVAQPSIPLDDSDQLPISLIQYVARKQQAVVLEDATQEPQFAHDRYIQSHQPKSVLCVPIQGHGNLLGILYLENNLTTNAFTPDRATILQVLTAQAAIALENAKLYQQLEGYSQTLETNNDVLQQEVSDRRRAENQLRQSLAEREVLLKEIHHRVKNNLQIISGLLQLQSQSVTDSATINILRESQHRIESMSLIHKKLYSSSDFGEIDQADYIPSLASSLLASYQITPGRVALHMEIAPILLNIDQAIPCGLIVNELVSNALKYAFPDDRPGEIDIHLHVLSSNQSDNQSSNQVELIIRDNGIGLPETVNWEYAQSLGLSLVHDLAVEQLEGSLTVERHPGTTFKIQFSPTPLLNSRLMVEG